MNKPIVIFRCDGNTVTGLGHVYRCIAIADMIADVFKGVFVSKDKTTIQNVVPQVYSVVEIPEGLELFNEAKWLQQNFKAGTIIIADGYNFNTEYQRSIKGAGFKLIYIDDLVSFDMHADVVINHTPGIDTTKYIKQDYTKIFSGINYIILRQKFLKHRAVDFSSRQKENSILISMGGGDANNITLKAVIAVLESGLFSRIDVLIGAAYRFKESLSQAAAESSQIKIHSNLNEQQTYDLMNNCKAAIIPASNTFFELLSLGVPCFCGYSADNQVNIYKWADSNQLVYSLGDLITTSADEIRNSITANYNSLLKKSETLNGYIDGKSGERILNIVKGLNHVN